MRCQGGASKTLQLGTAWGDTTAFALSYLFLLVFALSGQIDEIDAVYEDLNYQVSSIEVHVLPRDCESSMDASAVGNQVFVPSLRARITPAKEQSWPFPQDQVSSMRSNTIECFLAGIERWGDGGDARHDRRP